MQSMPIPGGSDAESMKAISAFKENKAAVARLLNAGIDEISKLEIGADDATSSFCKS